MNETFLKTIVKRVVGHLVAGEFDAIETITSGARLHSEEMSTAVSQYGRELTTPPDSAFDAIDIIQVRGADDPTWSIRFELWTKEQGKSDLTLEVTVAESKSGFRIELDDIHVH